MHSREMGCHASLSFPVRKAHNELQENIRVVFRAITLNCSIVVKRGILYKVKHLTLFSDS